ncbi:hypothetical protein ACEPAH_4725 [Sanghuangporus vaninii]
MRLSASALISAVLLGAVSASAASHKARHSKRHHDLAAREPKPEPIEERAAIAANATDFGLGKRGNDARFTFYDVGLGACGQYSSESDFIVALNTPQYGDGYPGPECFKKITITYGGKTTTATIMDQCPGCPYRGLDMSKGLFTFFASEDTGVIYGDWWFNDGSGGGDNTPTTSSTWSSSSSKWTPTTTWTPTSTSSSEWTPPTTTTWSSSSKSSTSSTWSSSSSTWSSSSDTWTSSSTESTSVSSTESSSSYDLSTGVVSGLAVATGSGQLSVPTATSGNVYNMNLALIELGALINAGAQLD